MYFNLFNLSTCKLFPSDSFYIKFISVRLTVCYKKIEFHKDTNYDSFMLWLTTISFVFVLDGFSEHFFELTRISTNHRFKFVANCTFNEEKSGHGWNSQLLGKILSLVNIDLDEGNTIWVAEAYSFRRDHFARPTPGSVAVDNCDSSIFENDFIGLISVGNVKVRHRVKKMIR